MNRKLSLTLCAAGGSLAFALGADAQDRTNTFFRAINTNVDNRPFFDTAFPNPDNYSGSAVSGTSTSTVVTGSGLTINGSSTEGSEFTDGNMVPSGVSITFDMSFTISSTTGALLVDGGNNGLGVDSSGLQTDPNTQVLSPNEQILFGEISFSNVDVVDPEGLIDLESLAFTNAGWTVLRSNDFNEAINGASASSDAAVTTDVAGFGTTSPGTEIGNNFTAGVFGALLPEVYITTDEGGWRIKGIGWEFDVEYDFASALIPGDTDGDGDVDDTDLGIAISNFTGPGGTGKTLAEGDTDGDGDVDDTDLGVMISGFTGPLSPAAVPEPTSLALLTLGGLLAARRRRA